MRSKRILIVDDDNRNIFALTAVLRSRGISVITADESSKGIAIIETNPDVAIVLLDMMMPEIDGYQAIRTIRQGPRKGIAIIAVTAQAMTGDREKCIDAGADDYVSKPIDIDRLMAILKKFM